MANTNLPFSHDAYDDLADLFLTEPVASGVHVAADHHASPLPFPMAAAARRERPAEPDARREPRLMAIMRVNLPVIAGPWLEQAAAAIASQAGPVVLIRERGGKACLDLVAGRDGQEAVAAALASPAESLSSAVQQLEQVIARWIVELPSSAEGRAGDWSVIDEMVLLTGADEAATVAAFAKAKSICNASSDTPRLSLVVVGSEEENARRSAARIAQACEESLDCAVELRAVVRRMQPVPMRHIGRFAQDGDLSKAVADALRQEVRRLRPAPERSAERENETSTAHRPTPVTIPRVVLRPRTTVPPTVIPIEPEAVPPRQPAPAHKPVADQQPIEPPRPEPALHQPTRDRTVTAQAAQSAANEAASAPESDATLLSLLPSLRSLGTTCPRAPRVEFGFDIDGGLHALVEDDSAQALQQLVVAIDWAREHEMLLRRVNPWLASASASGAGAATMDVTGHLFTSAPRQRRHLADGALRIHILARDPASRAVVTHLELN